MITIEERMDVTVVRLSRPPVNAFDLPMIEELRLTFEGLEKRPSQVGVVLTGTGQTFSAGVDTKAYAAYEPVQRRALLHAGTTLTAAIFALSCPLVAAVNGHALAGGFMLMLCCDYRLAVDDDTLRLGLTEARAGVPFPLGPLAIIKHEIPSSLLRQLTLSSRVLSPRELVAHAVIDAVTDRDSIVETAVATVRELAAQPGFRVAKRQLRGELAAELVTLAMAKDDPIVDAYV
jgi:enoyl-CoA hydratase